MPYLSAFLGLLIIISLYRLYFDPTTHKSPLRQAAEQINAAFEENDMVLHTSVGSFTPFLLYHPPAEHYLLWGDPDHRKSATAFESFGGQIITRKTLPPTHQPKLKLY